jgi:uncharacterized protein (TIGR03437 family)
MLKYCALISLCACSGYAAEFVTGMGARLVIGQKTFTQQDPGASDTLLGGVGGLAIAGDTLFVADSNRASFTPVNHRVLLYKNLSQQLPHPQAPILPFTGRCPACVGRADAVLGQADFTSTDPHLTRTGLRLPTGIASDGKRLVVADTGNNRILIWNSIPQTIDQPADLVLGQSDFSSLRAVVTDSKSFRAPQGVWIQDERLFVADTQNHRVMIWNVFPTRNDAPADLVLGQPNLTTVIQPDLTKQALNAQANTLLNPVAVTSDGMRLFVTDLGHNRVLIWNSIPTQNQQPANVVVGQLDMTTPYANYAFTGSPAVNADDKTNKETPVMCTTQTGTDPAGNPTYPVRCARTLDFPRYALSDGQRLFIADGGNDRVLIFNKIPTENGAPADVILGQPDEFKDEVSSTTDLFHPLIRQSAADIIATPTALAWDGTNLYVTDPSNRRILVYTPGEFLVQINGVRNAASREIYAIGAVTVSGTITADDQITVTIGGVDHKYKIVKDDTIATVITNLTKVINTDADPAVFAEEVQSLGLVKLVARKGGEQGNEITLTVTLSDKATIVATASGANLTNGQNAAIIAPGTLVTFLAREGRTLADQTVAADPTQNLPLVMGGVEVYFDGIRSPLLYVSPTEVRAQVPFEVQDANSISAFIRIQRNNGTVEASAAVAVPISQQNPGLFAGDGTDPRPAMAFHSSSYASGSILVDGIITPGDTGRILIEDRTYSYTVQTGDTLDSVRDAFVALINGNPEEKVIASVVPSFSRVRLRAKIAGPAGNGIPIATSASDGATLVITITNPQLCCANVAGAPVTLQNPAQPGEAIVFYATGLGIVGPQEALSAIKTGEIYTGPAFNDPMLHDPKGFVSAQINNTTANVLSASLKPGTVGIYEVLLELGGGTAPNPLAQVHISQDIYTSNVVTIPVSDPNTPQP